MKDKNPPVAKGVPVYGGPLDGGIMMVLDPNVAFRYNAWIYQAVFLTCCKMWVFLEKGLLDMNVSRGVARYSEKIPDFYPDASGTDD